LSSAVVCVHFKTKEDLLYEISRTGNDEALRDTTVSAETTEPAEGLSTIGDEQAAGDSGRSLQSGSSCTPTVAAP